LRRLRGQLARHGGQVTKGTVSRLERSDHGFLAWIGPTPMMARTVVLATGVVDRVPPIAGLDRVANTLVRWCPICDAYEVIDRAIGLLAPAQSGPGHALFLRTYSDQVTLFIQPGEAALLPAQRQRLHDQGIRVIEQQVVEAIAQGSDKVGLRLADGELIWLDALYPMIGCDVRAELAQRLGAGCEANGDIIVEPDQQTCIPGLYAVGDMVNALNQMSLGVAHATVAATAIHKSLPDNASHPVVL